MYCGIDVAKGKSQVCILNKEKKVVTEFEIQHDKEGFQELEKHLTKDIKIALETTGNYCKTLYNFLKDKYNVSYVDNLQMKNFAKLHYTFIKNDKVDAKLIALYITYDYKMITPIRMDELKDLSRLYDKTVKQSTRYKMMFKNQLNVIFPELEKKVCIKSTTGIPYMLLKYPTPKDIANADVEDLRNAMIEHLKKSSIFTIEYAMKIKEIAKESIGIVDYPVTLFQNTIKIMLFYKNLLEELNINMKECLKRTPYHKLLDEWGYNISSLSAIVGEIGDIRRFSNYKKFTSYCGFGISEKQSGKSMSMNCFLTKQGNRILRTVFYLKVLSYLRYKKEIYTFYHKLKDKGKHPKKCVIAAARKLAVKCYYDMMKCHA